MNICYSEMHCVENFEVFEDYVRAQEEGLNWGVKKTT
jgi:hypothetical protein